MSSRIFFWIYIIQQDTFSACIGHNGHFNIDRIDSSQAEMDWHSILGIVARARIYNIHT